MHHYTPSTAFTIWHDVPLNHVYTGPEFIGPYPTTEQRLTSINRDQGPIFCFCNPTNGYTCGIFPDPVSELLFAMSQAEA